MNWLAIIAQVTTILTGVAGAAWFVLRQNSKIAQGILMIKENDLRHLRDKLDAIHVDVQATATKLDRHLEWHLGEVNSLK